MFPFKFLEVSPSLKLLFYWRVFIKDLFENERRKGKLSSMDRLGQQSWMF